MQISGQRKKQQQKAPKSTDRGVATGSSIAAAPLTPASGIPHLRPNEDFAAPVVPSTPTGLPVAPASKHPLPAAQALLPPADPFSLDALLRHVASPRAAESDAVYDIPPGPRGDAHIRFMEPALAAAATVPFGSIAADGGAQLGHVMEKFGFAVVSDVLSAAELASVERMWADDLRSIIDLTRSTDQEKVKMLKDDPVHRWPTGKLALGAKFASDWGLPQGKAAWHCRGHPRVKATFAALFGDDRLCCGMDNVFFSNQPSTPGMNATAVSRLWPHADQNIAVKPSGRFECYQGVLYVWPATEDTSATVVWPRSHRLVYPRLMQNGRFKHHFCMLPAVEHADFARNARRVAVPPGAMLLWNSRTVHQGWPGGARLAFPICYEPTHRRDHNALARKEAVVQEGMPTTHWASLGKEHSVASKDSGPLTQDGVTIRHQAHGICLTESGGVKPEIRAML